MPRPNLELWENYTKDYAPDGTVVATCRHCSREFTIVKGSTSTITYHLKSQHPTQYAKMSRGRVKRDRDEEEAYSHVEHALEEEQDYEGAKGNNR